MKKYLNKELVIVAVLTSIAFVLRIFFLDQIPLGIHGDEGWTAIEAQRIISEGYIPMYSGSGLGQPIGPAYITAVFFQLFGESVQTLRGSMALFGVLIIPLFYLTLRKLFSINVSTIISLFFSFALFYLHFSRMGFMLISAPLFAIGALYFFFEFIKTKQYRMLIISAIICGIGMYSYNTYPLFPPTIGIALLYLWFRKKISLLHIITFILAFAASASLLIYQAVQDPETFFSHHKTYSVVKHVEYIETSDPHSKRTYVIQNGVKKIKHYITGNLQDTADGFGADQNVDWSILFFSVLGIILAFKHKNKLFIWLFFSFLLQLIPLVTTYEGYYRREVVGNIYLYIFAGYFLQKLFQTVPKAKTHYVTICISIILITQCGLNMWQYFVAFPKYDLTHFVYSPELYLSITKVREQPQDTVIVLYSDRFDCNYESIQFLLSDTTCINYDPSQPQNISQFDKPQANIFIDAYINQGLELQTVPKTILKLGEKTISVIEWIQL
ncbi:MAG: glycosyltransferase family 39 protein [bacterium]|nr:glycosyltransferase family 39 protein [bacterium]